MVQVLLLCACVTLMVTLVSILVDLIRFLKGIAYAGEIWKGREGFKYITQDRAKTKPTCIF